MTKICERCVAEEVISKITDNVEKNNNIVILVNCPHATKKHCHRKNGKASTSMKESGNRDDENMKRLCEFWFEKYGEESVLAGDLRNLAKENELFQYMNFSSRKHQVIFSKLLTNRSGRNYGEFKICADVSARYNRYYLESVGKKASATWRFGKSNKK